jgi:multiple sugar transport system substrate-binding protein
MALLSYQRNRLIVFAIVLLLGGVALLMTQGLLPGIKKEKLPGSTGPVPITLEFWNVFEDASVYSEQIAEYKKLYPHISINYTKVSSIEYREKLRDAFVSGTEPDIFAIHNTWLPLEQKRISPAPGSLAAVARFDEVFPAVVKFDFVREAEGVARGDKGERLVFALPLAIETLGLFYNKDYFDTANITSPPKTWEELLDYAKLFTQFDDKGEIKISGIALGSADNINRSTDIVGLLMMQGGARMTNENLTEATFDDQVWVGEGASQRRFSPGKEALEFYLAFSDKTRNIYSWDRDMPYSIDAFVEGKAAMMINYPHQIPAIMSKAPHLNFATAPVPQLQGRVEDINYASYFGLTVSKNSPNTQGAWQFIDFLMSPENVKKYLAKAKLPTSRRDLILYQQQDMELRHFANQIVSARSWYMGDASATETILSDMIKSAEVGERTIEEALQDAAARVTVVLQKLRK